MCTWWLVYRRNILILLFRKIRKNLKDIVKFIRFIQYVCLTRIAMAWQNIYYMYSVSTSVRTCMCLYWSTTFVVVVVVVVVMNVFDNNKSNIYVFQHHGSGADRLETPYQKILELLLSKPVSWCRTSCTNGRAKKFEIWFLCRVPVCVVLQRPYWRRPK